MNDTVIAIDVAKNTFELAVSNEPGRVHEHHRLSRSRLERFFANRPKATVAMEACGSAHYWARRLRAYGHHVILLPPHHVRLYRHRGTKNDRTDTKAILEALRNEDIHPVPVKTVEQHCLAALHRLRSAWLATRTARINTVRGVLRELGLFIPTGARNVVPFVRSLLHEPDSELPNALRVHLAEACDEIRALEHKMLDAERKLDALAKQLPQVARLQTIPGIGLLTATAIVGCIGELTRFSSARRFASFLGLVPKEFSSGDVRRLGRITKRGDAYIRMLLTHGARAVLRAAKLRDANNPDALDNDRLRRWGLNVQRRRGHNKATIAVANKLARTAWALTKHGRDYETQTRTSAQESFA